MTNRNFELALEFLFPSEGGYSNNSNDKGGATNMGITQSTYNYYLQKHKLPKKDVKNITRKEAKEIYFEEYWKVSGADKINDTKMAIALFDTAVLHGPYQAKKFYKESGGDFNKFLEIRKNSYKKIVEKDRTQKIFLNGWNNRVDNLKKYTNKINNVPTGKIFTSEEIGKMSNEEFTKNEDAINEQLQKIGVPSEKQVQEAVQNGTMIWVEGYVRDDGVEVKGYYRRK